MKDRGSLALAASSARVRGAAGWSISEETHTKTLFGWGSEIFLSVQNVTALAVSAGGVPVPEWAFMVDPESGVLRPSTLWGYYGQGVQLVYTAGYDPVPDGPKALCLELAARLYSNPIGDVITTYGSVTEQHRAPATAANPEDLRVDSRLSPYVVTALA